MPSFFLPTKKRSVVHVGSHSDSGFRAVAAGFIDNFLSSPHFHHDLLDTVLSRHFTYFPTHYSKISGVNTPSHHLKNVIENIPMPELIQTMAYTLRQLAVDEITKHPEQYIDVFMRKNRFISPNDMRQSDVYLNKRSLLALANVLNSPIDIRTLVPGKELFAPALRYTPKTEYTTTNPKIMLELKQQHYKPKLIHHSHFNSDAYDSYPQIKPVTQSVVDSDKPENILVLITAEKKRVTVEFKALYDRIMAMVKANELNKQHLLDLYIKSIETDNDAYEGFLLTPEYTNERSHSYLRSNNEELVTELVYAITHSTSINQKRADLLFSQIEEQESAGNRSRITLR